MYRRLEVVLAPADEIDAADPQIVLAAPLRRAGRGLGRGLGRPPRRGRPRHGPPPRRKLRRRPPRRRRPLPRAWLLAEVSADSDIPFRAEAVRFRETFDALLRSYDEAMQSADQKPVYHR